MNTPLMLSCFLSLTFLAGVAHAGELAVTITDIRAAEGTLRVAVVNSDAGWNNQERPVAFRTLPAAKGEMTLKFADLPDGKYAVQVMHDQNDNGKLDTNFVGIPSEGYGFSNNPNVMRRAHFDEAQFELVGNAAISIRLR